MLDRSRTSPHRMLREVNPGARMLAPPAGDMRIMFTEGARLRIVLTGDLLGPTQLGADHRLADDRRGGGRAAAHRVLAVA